jgi:hypothetical protein
MRELRKSLDGQIDDVTHVRQVVPHRTVNRGTFEIVDEGAW